MMRTGWQAPWVRAVTTLMTIAVLIMIFCFSMENAEASDRRSGVISGLIIRIFHPKYREMDASGQQVIYDSVQHIVRKGAHFTEFTVLGFLIRLCLESWFGHRIGSGAVSGLISFGIGTCYACTDEMHQLGTEGRSAQWTDVMVDSFGVFTGAALGTMLIRSLKRGNAAAVERKSSRE